MDAVRFNFDGKTWSIQFRVERGKPYIKYRDGMEGFARRAWAAKRWAEHAEMLIWAKRNGYRCIGSLFRFTRGTYTWEEARA